MKSNNQKKRAQNPKTKNKAATSGNLVNILLFISVKGICPSKRTVQNQHEV